MLKQLQLHPVFIMKTLLKSGGTMAGKLQSLCCRWVQGECSTLGDMDAPEVDPRLHRAAQALRERQVLFRYCAEEVATARHNAMFQRSLLGLQCAHAMPLL